MKQPYIKRWFTALLVAILAASAAVFADTGSGVFTKTVKRSEQKALIPLTPNGPQKLQAPQKEEEELVTVNILLKYDEEKYKPSSLASDKRFFPWLWDVVDFKSGESYPIEIRKSTEELVLRLRPKVNEKETYPIFLAIELNDVTPDMTIVFDTAEATERFEFIPLDETGTLITETSTIMADAFQYISIVSPNCYLNSIDTYYNELYENEEKPTPFPVIYTNKLSDHFAVVSWACIGAFFTEDFYLIQFPTVKDAGTYYNDFDLFMKHPVITGLSQYSNNLWNEATSTDGFCTSIAYLPTFTGYCDEELYQGKVYRTYIDSDTGDLIQAWNNNGISEKNYRVCIPEVTLKGTDIFQLRFKDILSETNTGETDLCIFMPPALPKDGEIWYYPLNEIGGWMQDGPYQRTLDNTLNPTYFPKVNPHLMMSEKQLSTIPGNNTPILVSALAYDESEGSLPDEIYPELIEYGFLEFGYIGRCLETRMSDRMLAEVEHSENDTYHIFTIKNENVLIDNEIQGTNTTTLGLMKNRADFVPPTLQTLQIKDAEGNINDRINGPGSVMEIYAGDFYYYFDWDTYADMMKCRPLEDMLVEYAPTGTTDYKEMTFTEDPDKFFLPGSGYFFSNPMDDILADCCEGWYDLRVTIMDEQGNFQTQVISPVFYIGDGVGIEQPKREELKLTYADGIISSSKPGVMTLWALDGSKLAESTTSTIDLNAYPHGVYIAKVKTPEGETQIKVAK